MAVFRDGILEENGLKCWITGLLATNRGTKLSVITGKICFLEL